MRCMTNEKILSIYYKQKCKQYLYILVRKYLVVHNIWQKSFYKVLRIVQISKKMLYHHYQGVKLIFSNQDKIIIITTIIIMIVMIVLRIHQLNKLVQRSDPNRLYFRYQQRFMDVQINSCNNNKCYYCNNNNNNN